MKRLCINVKDIQRITGRSERYSRNILLLLRTHLNKLKHQEVTGAELAEYLGLKPEDIDKYLN